MKKIYLFLFSVVFLFSISLQSANAQDCLGVPQAKAFDLNGTCLVFVSNTLPNALVVLVDLNLNIIGSSTSDQSGYAAFPYTCGITAFRVSAFLTNPQRICNVFVPPAAPLPSKLSDFTAQVQGSNSVTLKWKSILELDSYTYTIEKSTDGKNFQPIGEVKAAGNSSTAINYNFADESFTTGNSYFRLKQVDIDGRFEYSKIIYVNNKQSAGIVRTVAPNPFTSDIQLIGINSAEINPKNIRVFNAYGQLVQFRITGSNALTIDPSAARGVYILKIKNQTFKIQKN